MAPVTFMLGRAVLQGKKSSLKKTKFFHVATVTEGNHVEPTSVLHLIFMKRRK